LRSPVQSFAGAITILEAGPKSEAADDLLADTKLRLANVEALLSRLADIGAKDSGPDYPTYKQPFEIRQRFIEQEPPPLSE
jgi:hypothetical protein